MSSLSTREEISAKRQIGAGDEEICIAIIDSRADLAHPCFIGGRLEELMPVWLRSVMGPSGSLHGTHVSSIIFGQPGSAVEGLAPRCRGVVIPVYGETAAGELRSCSQEDLARAVSLALEAGAHLINISGGELIRVGDADPFLEQVVRRCEQQNVVIVAATGNEGCECLHMPAALPSVLAVGAATVDGLPSPFSNWDESFAEHGVLAPGENILGAIPGGGVARHSGTSFACPIVTGAAAQILGLQIARGQKPDPRGVRDALVKSAIPCKPEEDQAHCERMLGGRLNVEGACELLFEIVGTAASGLRDGVRGDTVHSPRPLGGGRVKPLSAQASHSTKSHKQEGKVMERVQSHIYPQRAPGVDQGALPQGADPLGLAIAPQESWSAGHSATPSQTQATMAVGQSATLQPQQTSCGCGGQTPQHGALPMQQETYEARPNAWPAEHAIPSPNPPLMAPSYGAQAALTPAQRTAVMAAFPGGRAETRPATASCHGVTPSQSAYPIPMPNDFITAANSQLVYVIGTLGYDFITDARRDYFVQQFHDMSQADEFAKFAPDLGLTSDTIYLPEDHRAMAAYMCKGPGPRYPNRPAGRAPEDVGSVCWVLYQENQPLYALRPLQTLSLAVLSEFADILYDQSRPETLPVDPRNKLGASTVNPRHSDRVSIAGRIIGDITLYNGQTVPTLDVSLRALYNWTTDLLLKDVLGSDVDPKSEEYLALKNFLDRIYYEVRNLGQAPSDRAINYLTTNIFQAREAFTGALKEHLELDSVYAEKSPLCRPKSDCWDVVMRFFDPRNRLQRALEEYRLTVDVNDISPVGIGSLRRWSRFA